MAKKTAAALIVKPKDEYFLELLEDDLPDNFDHVRFMGVVIKIAQDIRKMEGRKSEGIPENKKLLNSEQQKRLLKNKLPKKSIEFHELLHSLPDEVKTRIDFQHYHHKRPDDARFMLVDWASFTDVVADLVLQLNQFCNDAHTVHNQGWRNPYKTQEAILALEFTKAGGGDIKVSKNHVFFYVLKSFINYCQVENYNAGSVDEVRIRRVLREISSNI